MNYKTILSSASKVTPEDALRQKERQIRNQRQKLAREICFLDDFTGFFQKMGTITNYYRTWIYNYPTNLRKTNIKSHRQHAARMLIRFDVLISKAFTVWVEHKRPEVTYDDEMLRGVKLRNIK